MVDVPEETLRVLNGSKALLDKLLSGKTRSRQEALIKEHYPETQTTADIAEPYVAEIKDLKKSFEDFKNEIKGNKLDDRLNTEIAELKSQDWTDEGIDKLKKLMIDREIPSIKDAAAVWEKRNP